MINLNKPLIGALLCALLAVAPAWAQTYKDSGGTVVPGVVPIPATVGGTASLAVTNASGTVNIPASDAIYPSINLTNAGTVALYYALGASATTSSAYLGPGASACIAAGSATTVAAITASSTTTLQVTQANSCIVGLNGGGSGGGGGSGTVTSVGFTGGLISVGTPTTTPAFTIAGSSGGIPYFSSATTWASSAALAVNALMIGGGAGAAPSTFTLAGDCTFSSPNITCTSINGKAVTLGGALTTTGAGATTLAFASAGVAYTFPASAASLAAGPGSSTAGHIADFSGTDGVTLADSGVLASGVVSGPASAVSGNIASYNGTGGKTVQDSGVSAAGIAPPALVTTDAQIYPLWQNINPTGGGAAPSQNFNKCVPFQVTQPQHWDELILDVTTLGTGPLNVALYTDAIDSTTHKHQPQTSIATGSFTVTSVAFATVALGTGGVGIAIPVGLNWICSNDATASDAVRFTVIPGTTSALVGLVGTITAANALSTSQVNSWFVSGTAGTWPSFVGTAFTENNGTSTPFIGYRVATSP